MENYQQFTNENIKYRLFIEETEDTEDIPWKLILDMSKIWKDFTEQKISIVDFNNQYSTILTENSENIAQSCGDEAWNDIEPVVVNELRGAVDVEGSDTIYDKLYDIFDKYEIYIKMNDK